MPRYQHIRARDAETHSDPQGETVSFLATARETDGRVSIFHSRLDKGKRAPCHYHEIDDEIFFVISGRVQFGVADELFVAEAGDLVIAGPDVPRWFEALEDSRLLVVNVPGGPSEGFLRDVMGLEGPPTDNDRLRFQERYKIHSRDRGSGSNIGEP